MLQFKLRKRTWVLLLPLLLLSFTWVGISSVAAQESLEACVFTQEMAEGQGFNVAGLGFNVQGLGFNVAGLGFNVAGLGFNVAGLGTSVDQIVDEIRNNVVMEISDGIVTETWMSGRLPDVIDGFGFGDKTVAIVVVDDFAGAQDAMSAPSIDDPHGKKVTDVINALLESIQTQVPDAHIVVEPVDISDNTTNYRVDLIDDLLRTTVNDLFNRGIKHIVFNFSIGAVPCYDTVTLSDGQQVTFDFDEVLAYVQHANQPQPVVNSLQCVSSNYDGTYIAHFGYNNPNGTPVSVPPGTDNFLSGGGLTAEELQAQTPTYFGRPNVVAGDPGQSDTYPNSPFQVIFQASALGDTLSWTLYGHTVTADPFNPDQDCEPHPEITNLFECVIDNGDGTLIAHLGYNNESGVPQHIPAGPDNFLSGGGLSDAVRRVVTPIYFGVPNVVDGEPGRSASFPNSAFQITFSAASPLTWTLFGNEVTVSAESEPCVVVDGYGFSQYFYEILNLNPDQIDDLYNQLFQVVDDNPDIMSDLSDQLHRWLEDSASGGDFAIMPFASAGNFRYFYPRTNPDDMSEPLPPAPPLTPASLPETMAISALLGNVTDPVTNPVSDYNRDILWRFSQDGNIAVPGGSIKIGTNGYFVGTSFASPYASVLGALWLTYPNACTYDTPGLPPLNRTSADDFLNALFTDPNSAYPLTCALPQAIPVTIDIRPDVRDNQINLNSSGQILTAILSDETFDATQIDADTIFLAGAPAVAFQDGYPKIQIHDENKDGLDDMILHFNIQDMELDVTDTEATLIGQTLDGQFFTGTDLIEIINLTAPRLKSPRDGAKVNTNYVTLEWFEVDPLSCYDVQVSTAVFSDGAPIVEQATVVYDTVYTTAYLAKGTYYWRVQVGGSCDIPPGPWSEVRSFRVQ
ncbi:MAG: hypothetical protein H6672_03965 [Anaerolineaceae bacterium]|nr:hypothetical protein [Anaerolineaceae bacterium]